MDKYNILIEKLNTIAGKKAPFIIAIDGRCGSGKTTLGEKLRLELDATLFHMDDFFLRAEQRTPLRLATPGEFADHERFLEEILQPVMEGDPVFLRRFDHSTFQPRSPEPVEIKPIVIVEGSYCSHKTLRPFYDFMIFMTTDIKTQQARILARSGPEKFTRFVDEWIPREELYFTTLDVPNEFDFLYET